LTNNQNEKEQVDEDEGEGAGMNKLECKSTISNLMDKLFKRCPQKCSFDIMP